MRAIGWLLPRIAIRLFFLIFALGAVFVAVDRLPGDAASIMLGRRQTEVLLVAEKSRLGLDQPVGERFLAWLGAAVRGDFGETARGRDIDELVLSALPVTLTIVALTFVLTVFLSMLLASWWVRARSSSPLAAGTDLLTTSIIAIPEFVVGVLLIAVFALGLGLLPAVTVSSDGLPVSASMYVLPIASLVIPQVAWNSRILRAALLDALSTAPVRAARLAGVEGFSLMRRHVLPLAVPSFAASMATSTGMLVAGSVSVEALFNQPGLGLLVAEALNQRDLTLLLALLSVIGIMIFLVLTLADAIKVFCTPKVAL